MRLGTRGPSGTPSIGGDFAIRGGFERPVSSGRVLQMTLPKSASRPEIYRPPVVAAACRRRSHHFVPVRRSGHRGPHIGVEGAGVGGHRWSPSVRWPPPADNRIGPPSVSKSMFQRCGPVSGSRRQRDVDAGIRGQFELGRDGRPAVHRHGQSRGARKNRLRDELCQNGQGVHARIGARRSLRIARANPDRDATAHPPSR